MVAVEMIETLAVSQCGGQSKMAGRTVSLSKSRIFILGLDKLAESSPAATILEM